MQIDKRNIGMCVVLSIVTCGIYSLYWYYKLLDELYRMNNMESKAGMDLVLSIITCGIYFLYMQYKMGQMLYNVKKSYNLDASDASILYIILGFFGLSIITYCIVQSDMNERMIDIYNRSGGSPRLQ